MKFDINNIPIFIPIVSTIFGVLIGWILNELRDFIKLRRENKQIINSVLFNLLEIRFFVSKTDLEKFTKITIEYLKSMFPNENPKDIQIIINQVFNIFFQTIIAEQHTEEIKKIESKYKESISLLSRIDPILAYNISGKLNLYNYLEYLKDYSGKVNEIFELELNSLKNERSVMNLEDIRNILEQALRPVLYKEALLVITNDIKKVSKKLGIIKYLNSNTILKRQDKAELDDDLIKILDSHFHVMFSKLGK
jgi:hypothetical protein